MEFDGLHVIRTTYNYWQPQRGQGVWQSVQTLYERLIQEGYDCKLSKPLPKITLALTELPNHTLVLTFHEAEAVTCHIAKLIGPQGDRIVAGLSVRYCVVTPTYIQLLFVPALLSHQQQIGRIKSQTSSKSFRKRGDQQRIWASGYWFAGSRVTLQLPKLSSL
jgi:hypothetical protein